MKQLNVIFHNPTFYVFFQFPINDCWHLGQLKLAMYIQYSQFFSSVFGLFQHLREMSCLLCHSTNQSRQCGVSLKAAVSFANVTKKAKMAALKPKQRAERSYDVQLSQGKVQSQVKILYCFITMSITRSHLICYHYKNTDYSSCNSSIVSLFKF